MNIVKRCMAILLLVGLSAGNMNAFGWGHSKYDEDSILKGALVVAAAGCAGTVYLLGAAAYNVFKNSTVDQAIAVKLGIATILGLGSAGLVKLVNQYSGHFPG